MLLKDVARLELGTQLYNAIGRHDGKPSAVIAVFQIPGTNALEVANEIKKTMEDLKTRFPRGHGLHGLARHDAAGHRRHQRDPAHARSKRSSWSSSSCSCSCRTGARR